MRPERVTNVFRITNAGSSPFIINFIHRKTSIATVQKKLKVKQEKPKNTQKISTVEQDPAECNRKPTLVVY